MTDSYIGKACPFCQTRLTGSEQVKVCPRCRIPHHVDCWRENGGCTTYGCVGEGAPGSLAAGNAPPPIPGSVEVTLEELSVCQECRRPLSVWDTICPACGADANAPARAGRTPSGPKSAATACLLNIPVPGVGYFYLGEAAHGLLALFIALIAGVLSWEYYGLAAVPVYVFAMVDCYGAAKRAHAAPQR